MFAGYDASGSASADELKRFSGGYWSPGDERSQDRVEHQVQLLAKIFSKETQHQVAVLLQQLIFPAIAAVLTS
jgi:hypothetical protein